MGSKRPGRRPFDPGSDGAKGRARGGLGATLTGGCRHRGGPEPVLRGRRGGGGGGGGGPPRFRAVARPPRGESHSHGPPPQARGGLGGGGGGGRAQGGMGAPRRDLAP